MRRRGTGAPSGTGDGPPMVRDELRCHVGALPGNWRAAGELARRRGTGALPGDWCAAGVLARCRGTGAPPGNWRAAGVLARCPPM